MCFAEEILNLANDSIVLPVTDDNPSTVDNTVESPTENIMVDKFSTAEDASELDSEKSYMCVATMVNIFRLKTAFNQTWNVAYYFNCGSLDGDELLRQLTTVIIACKSVGIKIKLQISNAGWANMKAAAYLTDYKCNSLPVGKPQFECVRYSNAMATNRYIYISLCSVHGLENYRNQLCSRDLFNRGHCTSFSVIQDLYHHLKFSFDNWMNVDRLRHISRSVAFPDHFSCQNVSFAEQPFEEETIAYQCQKVCSISTQ